MLQNEVQVQLQVLQNDVQVQLQMLMWNKQRACCAQERLPSQPRQDQVWCVSEQGQQVLQQVLLVGRSL